MKKRILLWLLCVALLVPLIAGTAYADCAPKPSVNVDVLCAKNVIVTLLAEQERYGPNNTVKPGELPEEWQHYESDLEQMAWARFRDYQDPDGYHFWGQMDWHGIDWGYYPPERFKIAVYFPENDVLIVSEEVYETYAFHSDFRLWIQSVEYTDGQIVSMDLKKNFDWMEEVWEFFIRVLLTLAVEFAVAWLMGYREKRHVKVILSVNLVTQVILNGMLTLWYIFDGPLDALLRLVLAEIVVLVLESVIYVRRLSADGQKKGRAVAYAFAANLSSLIAGWILIEHTWFG